VRLRGRVSRVNRFILIVALLWIATTVALVVEASPGHAHAKSHPHPNVDVWASALGSGKPI